MHLHTFLAVVAAPIALADPAPVPAPFPKPQPKNDLVSAAAKPGVDIGSFSSAIPAILNNTADVLTAADAIERAITNGTLFGTDMPVLVKELFSAAKPTATPTSIAQAQEWAAANVLANALELILDGFTPSDLQAVVSDANPSDSSTNNANDPVPSDKSFYNNVNVNALFFVDEETLRAAIYIPPGFTWGKKQPIVLSPDTGGYGSSQFALNIGKLLATTDYADPVNAEYVAYSLQYFYALTSRKLAIVTWSQGSPDTHWAFKYWPFIPSTVTDHIAISPDYHGTVLAYILCPGFEAGNNIACVPSVLQQLYRSNFVNKLRSNNGDSAYVPTTTVYSLTDEIVQPQIELRQQGACLGLPAGGLYTHAGVLYNPVAYALLTDALLNDGPGLFDRVSDQCRNVAAPGISLSDVIETQATIPMTALNIFLYKDRVTNEPETKSYATY